MNPGDALYANLARLSYSASLRAQVSRFRSIGRGGRFKVAFSPSKAALRRAASRLTVGEVLQLSLLFCFPWFVGNYCYQAALSETEAAIVQASPQCDFNAFSINNGSTTNYTKGAVVELLPVHPHPGGHLSLRGRRPHHSLQVFRRALLHGRRRPRLLLRSLRRGRRHPCWGIMVGGHILPLLCLRLV